MGELGSALGGEGRGGGGRSPPHPRSSVLCAACSSVLRALCSVLLCPLCSVLHAPCSVLRALCSCSVLCAPCAVLRALCSVLRALCGTVLLSILRGVWPGRRGTVLYLCTFEPQPRYAPPCSTYTCLHASSRQGRICSALA